MFVWFDKHQAYKPVMVSCYFLLPRHGFCTQMSEMSDLYYFAIISSVSSEPLYYEILADNPMEFFLAFFLFSCSCAMGN